MINDTETTMLDPMFVDYLTIAETDLTMDTLRGYRTAYKQFSQYLDEYGINFAEITHQEVQQYILLNTHKKASTLKHQMKSIRAAFNYGRNCTLVVQRYDDPFARLRYPVQPDTEPITFTNQEMKQLYDAIETDREWLVFHLFAYAGLRRHEVCNLRWEDIDFQSKILTVTQGKGNKLRRLPLHPKLQEALAEHRCPSGWVIPTHGHYYDKKAAGTKLDPDSLSHSNKFWFQRAGVQKGNHTFRRTMNSVLKERGASHEDREQIMGWAPRDIMGRHYTRFLDKTLHEAICRLDYGLDRKKQPNLRLITNNVDEVVKLALVEAGAIN